MSGTVEEFDAIVIGSGAGGAPIAHTLVRAGKSVLMIEKGPLFRPQADDPMRLSDYKRDELISDGPEKKLTISGLANSGASFYTSHVEPDLNDEPHIYRNSDRADPPSSTTRRSKNPSRSSSNPVRRPDPGPRIGQPPARRRSRRLSSCGFALRGSTSRSVS